METRDSSLAVLPTEIIQLIGESIRDTADLNAFLRVNRYCYQLFNPYLYKTRIAKECCHCYNCDIDWVPAIWWAAQHGRLSTIQKVLDAGAVRLGEIPTLLPWAAKHGNYEVIKFLLDSGDMEVDLWEHVDMHTHGRNPQRTALSSAAKRGNLAVAKLLIDHGANLNQIHESGMSPLYDAASRGDMDMARLLLDNGAEIDGPSSLGWTPLNAAVGQGHMEMARLLLECGANPAGRNEYTPMHGAAFFGYADILQLLIDYGGDTDARDDKGHTPLYWAAHYSNIEEDAARILLERGCADTLSAREKVEMLKAACADATADFVRLVLEQGVDPNAICYDAADSFGDYLAPNICTVAGRGDVEIARLLLEYGANVHQKHQIHGWTALLSAVREGHVGMIEFLLDQGDNIEATSPDGGTALHCACAEGDVQVVEMLLSRGANIKTQNVFGASPAHSAAFHGNEDVLKILLGVSEDDINQADNNGRTPFFYAAMRGKLEALARLMTDGATGDPENLPEKAHLNFSGNRKDIFGLTPLVAAARNRHLRTVRALMKLQEGHDPVDISDGEIPVMLSRGSYGEDYDWLFDRIDPSCAFRRRWDQMAPWCRVCAMCITGDMTVCKCTVCDGGLFVVCRECSETETSCRVPSHEKEEGNRWHCGDDMLYM